MHPGPRNGLVRTRPEPKHSLGRPARLRCQQRYLSLCEHACLQPSSWRNVSWAMTHSEATGHDSSSTSTRAPRATRSVDSTHKRRFFLSRPHSVKRECHRQKRRNHQVAFKAMQEKHTFGSSAAQGGAIPRYLVVDVSAAAVSQ
jgi:hypothetical protein